MLLGCVCMMRQEGGRVSGKGGLAVDDEKDLAAKPTDCLKLIKCDEVRI